MAASATPSDSTDDAGLGFADCERGLEVRHDTDIRVAVSLGFVVPGRHAGSHLLQKVACSTGSNFPWRCGRYGGPTTVFAPRNTPKVAPLFENNR